MTTYKLPYFGNLDIDSLEDYHSIIANIESREIEIDINFPASSSTVSTMKLVEKFIQSITQIDKQNQENYLKDFLDDGETASYIEFYLEEFDEEELIQMIGTNKSSISLALQLLNKLELVRVGIYPDQDGKTGFFGVFDYSIKIEDEFCNQLLVVNTNENGVVQDIDWES